MEEISAATTPNSVFLHFTLSPAALYACAPSGINSHSSPFRGFNGNNVWIAIDRTDRVWQMANGQAVRLNSSTRRKGRAGRGEQEVVEGPVKEEQTVSEMEFHYGGAHGWGKGSGHRMLNGEVRNWFLCLCTPSFIYREAGLWNAHAPRSDGHCARSSQ